ncbi:MAG: ABC transporter permease, partial [Prolixibacteraceae bacterium]|nr:ABC transporter permease [Prolixibacteraceae bacterium]
MGLTLGLSGIIFISLFLKNELAYDTFHSKADRIYRFTTTNPGFLNNTHFARLYNSEQIPDVVDYFPEIESYVRLAPIRGGVMLHNEKYYDINEAFVCDSTFFNVFDAQLVIGNKNTVLNAPGSMVVTKSFAQKVFGNENPVGEVLSIPSGQFYGQQIDFTVKGVMEEFPQNSHFHPDLLTTSSTGPISWWAFSYVLLNKNTNPHHIISGYSNFIALQNDQRIDQSQTQLHLQNIKDIHLHSDKLREIENNGNMVNIYVLAIAAFILLLISISNYASLNLGMAGFNQKFINVNRILGSGRNTNLKYFAIESCCLVLVSLLFTLLIGIATNLFIEKNFNINLLHNNLSLIIFLFVSFGLIGIIAGMQPVLKQNLKRFYQKSDSLVGNNIFVSKGIIITQYTLAIILIASVLIITRQTNFALNNSMGVKEDNILVMEEVHASVQQKFEVFKEELLKHNTIQAVSAMMEPPGGEANDMFEFQLEGQTPPANEQRTNLVGVFPCDYSFANLFNLHFLSGKNFTKDNTDTEGSGEYILNESALHHLGMSTPDEAVGKDFKLQSPAQGIDIPRGKIIGVVKDFHLSSMKKKVNPLVFFKRDQLWLINFVIAYQPGRQKEALSDIKEVWTSLFPAYPFHYESVGSMYRKVYKTELLQARLLTIFTVISLFISSMGLLGISLLMAQQRVKEIGVRKVNGAKVSEILQLLNGGFVKWVA